MQPPTRGPEDEGTKTMTVARPHHVCVPLSGRRQHRPARSTCADVLGVRSSPLGADMVSKSRNMSADMLFTVHARAAGLDAADHLLCEVAVCTRLGD